MFLKVFTKKNLLLYFLISICIIIFSISGLLIRDIFLLKNKEAIISTFSSITNGENFFIDLNGDGKKDALYISSSYDQYTISCNINNKTYSFDIKSPLNTLGFSSKSWPMNIYFEDLSRDKIPEIITQSSEHTTPIIHIFKWTGSEFKDLYCSTNEICGIVDSNNNASPKIISFSLNDTIDNIQKHMIINNSLKNISYAKLDVPGLNTIKKFINTITLSYNEYILPDIFSNDIPNNLIQNIDMLDKENFYYIFQDGFFKDISWDENGNINSVNWHVRFRKCSKSKENDITLLEWNLILKNINNTFMINEIK